MLTLALIFFALWYGCGIGMVLLATYFIPEGVGGYAITDDLRHTISGCPPEEQERIWKTLNGANLDKDFKQGTTDLGDLAMLALAGPGILGILRSDLTEARTRANDLVMRHLVIIAQTDTED